MLRTVGVVQACGGSPRFRATLQRRVGNQPVLSWVARRLTDCLRLDGVIVLARQPECGNSFSHLVPLDVPVFVSSEPDALGSLVRALEQYPAEAVVRVRGDNLFVDPELIDRLATCAETHSDCDYIGYQLRDGRPAIFSPVGIYGEWFRARALRRAAQAALNPIERDHITPYILSHPEQFRIRLLPAPNALDRDDVRLTLDGEEDWEHVQAIFDALGPERLEWQRIARLLDHQPALRHRMAALNRARAAS